MKYTTQEKIKMSIKDIAKNVRLQLKKEYPKCVFSVRIERYSMGQSLYISLMSAPFDVYAQNKDCNNNPIEKAYSQLNYYQLRNNFSNGICNGIYLTRQAWDCLQKAVAIADVYNYDNSDLQTDYFDVRFHLHIEIGQWNKPFTISL